MRALVLWADRQSPNLGVQVLGAGSELLLKEVWPEIQVTHHNFGASSAPVRLWNLRTYGRELIRRDGELVTWLRSFDVVLDTRSGDSFSDIYGLHRLAMMSAMSEAVHRSGTPIVLGPQTIGPFRTRRGQLLARRALRQSAAVMARDDASAKTAVRLGVPVHATTTDVVFLLPQPAPTQQRDVVLNISGLLWAPNSHVDHRRYRKTVTDLHRRLVDRGRTVSLMAHVLDSPSKDNDVPAIHEFADAVAADVEVVVPESLDDARTIVSSASVVIGSRMHACLNSLSTGTPAIPLAYSRKFHPLLSALGWNTTVDVNEVDATDQVLGHLDDPHFGAALPAIRAHADSSLRLAQTALAEVL